MGSGCTLALGLIRMVRVMEMVPAAFDRFRMVEAPRSKLGGSFEVHGGQGARFPSCSLTPQRAAGTACSKAVAMHFGWALAVYLFVWSGSLQGLLLVSLVADGSHRAIVSATSNQLRLVLHHHARSDEHHAADHAHDRDSSGTVGDVPSDHELSLADHGEHATTTSASGAVPVAKALTVVSLATVNESPGLHLRADRVDPYQFLLTPTLRSHRTTVLLI